MPYKNATQSAVFYSLLEYDKVFISTDVGENGRFLRDNGLEKLLFDRKDEKSIIKAFEYAKNNYSEIKQKLKSIKKKYEWQNIITKEKLKKIYE